MSLDFSVNYVAVVVATIAVMVFGFVFFLPQVFGAMALIGRPNEQMRPGPEFVVSILAALVNAWTLAVLARSLGASTLADGLVLGALVGVGFFGAAFAANTVISKRPWGLFAIDAAHGLLGQMIMAAIVAVWR
jgi:amino acid transporter